MEYPVLKGFVNKPLFDACADMLEHLHISYVPQSKTPMSFPQLYSGITSNPMPGGLADLFEKISATYFLGSISQETLRGENDGYDLARTAHYQGMLVFAADAKQGASFTRTELSTLIRGFNRIAKWQPVILFLRNADRLTLATCERSEYKQEWRDGERLGKVSILRDINCRDTHRGHIDIIELLGDKRYDSFDELYRHWMDVFSSELLTKKFYTELANWYAWVIESGRVKFPNDLTTTDDDTHYTQEGVIRLITRLIFVWFLKQKGLVPEELFDERYIRDNFIEEFNPHDRKTLLYDAEQSKYYRLILQNLFFAMLNRPIREEDKDALDNRRFMRKSVHGLNPDYGINNLMRYASEFMPGGADKLLALANSRVPFLNGGLFECLDDKDKKLYYDGFSENARSLAQLSFPDYFFFGSEVGTDVDLSKWYDDKRRNRTRVRGIIDILNSYNFTVEENTPLEQEVSLDPELLGKAFENLLAAYNEETKTTARKMTGSFYTPREIVQYMVDESLILHLRRTCPDIDEATLRNLFSYSSDEIVNLSDEERRAVIRAIYHCKILDPACGSGAFPMGLLQQMVHALRKLDPDNELWREFILETALAKDREAYNVEDEAERSQMRKDIEQAFNRQVNDPDYARKLYLIENCIYGVDIQPIAMQISKLRFFITLVAEQRPTKDPADNFGIRPLPNLETKFVAANSLIPLEKNENLFSGAEDIRKLKAQLAEANHRNFLAKTNRAKRTIRERIKTLRRQYAAKIEDLGAISTRSAQMLADWDMFDQNHSAPFFDPEWMFGIGDGFDIVIGNPPYISVRTKNFDAKLKPVYSEIYQLAIGQYDLYVLFIELANRLLCSKGVLSYIVPTRLLSNENFMPARLFLKEHLPIIKYVNAEKPFENVSVEANIMVSSKYLQIDEVVSYKFNSINNKFELFALIDRNIADTMPFSIFPFTYDPQCLNLFSKLQVVHTKRAGSMMVITRGLECGYKDECITNSKTNYPLIKAEQINKFCISGEATLFCSPDFSNTSKFKTRDVFENLPKLVTKFCSDRIQFALDTVGYYNTNSVYNCSVPNTKTAYLLLGVLNCPVSTFWFNVAFMNIDCLFPHIQKNQLEEIPIPIMEANDEKQIIELVDEVIKGKQEGRDTTAKEQEIDRLVYALYGLTEEEISLVEA